MRVLRLLRLRLRSLVARARVEDELERELSLHLEQLTREGIEAGLDPAEAARAARRAFGPVDRTRALCRDTRRVGWIEDAGRDARYAWRRLVAAPVFTLTAVASLALGLGSLAGIAGLVDAVLVRTLPVADPAALVFLQAAGRAGAGGAPPYPVFARMRDQTTAFTGMAAFATDDLRVEIDGRLEQVSGQVASGEYFEVLGLVPAAGRLMTASDDRTGQAVAVVSHAYATRRFGGVHTALGRSIVYRERPHLIIGVTPRAFRGLQPGQVVDVTFPISVAGPLLQNTDQWWFHAVARLRAGEPRERATAQVDAIFQSFMRGSRASHMRLLAEEHFARMVLTPAARGLDGLRTRFRAPLLVMALVGVAVLLVTCLNVATLLIVSVAAREREFAVRQAAGAGAGRLFRQLAVETLLLFSAGALAGLPVAHLLVTALTTAFAVGRTPIRLDVQYDWRIAVLLAGVTLTAGVLTALAPALRARRRQTLAGGFHGTRLAGSVRLTMTARLAAIAQCAVSLVLVVAALLFARTLANLRDVDLGFAERRVLTMSLEPLGMADVTPEAPAGQRAAFWQDVLRRVRAVPGVRHAALSVLTPLSGRDRGRFVSVAGYVPAQPQDRLIRVNLVSEDYLETFGMAVQEGRALTAADVVGTRVAVVNRAAVRHFFGGRNPIGEVLDFENAGRYHVVGVVADHKHRQLREAPMPLALVPLWQPTDEVSRITLSVASDGSPLGLARAVIDRVHAVHARTLVSDVIAVPDQIDATLVSERVLATLSLTLAGMALVLAAIGLYGGLSHAVARRRGELGVRLALGAPPRQLTISLYRDVLTAVACGVGLGAPIAWLLLPRAATLLFGVEPTDTTTYVAGAALLALVGCLAAVGPARQARAISPAEALRDS